MLCSKTSVGRKTFHAPDSTEIYRRPKFQAWPIEFFGNLLLPSLYCIGKPYKPPKDNFTAGILQAFIKGTVTWKKGLNRYDIESKGKIFVPQLKTVIPQEALKLYYALA